MFFLGLVSSDQSLCHAIGEQLKQDDDACQYAVFPSLDEALSAWSETLPPLIFWDAQSAPASQEMTAFLTHRLQQAHPSPLLFVLGEPPESVESFGIAEHFVRPLRLGFFLARLHFYQRLLNQAPQITFPVGPWLFDPRTRTLTAPEVEPLKLTEKEAALLEYLCAAAAPVSRDELLAALWGYDSAIDTHTLETHIYRLRRKLMSVESVAGDVFVLEQGGYKINPAWREGAAGA